MTTLYYNPLGRFGQMRGEINRLFGRFDSAAENRTRAVTSNWSPAVDIKEGDAQFVIEADVPGVDPKDVEVTMHDGVLSIRGKRDAAMSEENEKYRRVERARGSFHRSFTLPDTANAEGITAKCKNGVLEVVIPKRAPVHPRRVTIES